MEKIVSPSNINEILSSAHVVLIDFWAPWCGPCRVLSPTVAEVAADFEGRATVAKCNVDDCEDIASNYGIRNIPALLFFRNGELADRMVGVVSKQEIERKITSLL